MDPNDLNKTEPNLNSTNRPSVDGFIPPRMSMGENVPPAPVATTAESVSQQLSNAADDKSAKGTKGSKFVAVLFVVLFVLAAAGAGYLYMQCSKAKDDLTKANSSLQSAEATATQSINDLNSSLSVQEDYATELNQTAAQLKTLCGTACASITIPVAPESLEEQ